MNTYDRIGFGEPVDLDEAREFDSNLARWTSVVMAYMPNSNPPDLF